MKFLFFCVLLKGITMQIWRAFLDYISCVVQMVHLNEQMETAHISSYAMKPTTCALTL